jgi:hypothetical protein
MKLVTIGFVAMAALFGAPAFAGTPGDEYETEQPPLDAFSLDAFSSTMDASNSRLTMGFGSLETGSLGMTVDGPTQKVYFNANGHAFSATFSQVAFTAFPSDAGARNQFLSDLNSLTTDDSMLTFQSMRGEEPVPMACALSPCPMRWMRDIDGHSQLVELHRRMAAGQQPPDFSGIDPGILAYDRQRFEAAKANACNKVGMYGLGMVGAGAAAIPSCAAADSELGALGCLGAGAAAVIAYDSLKDAIKQCNAEYKGPGTWEN